MTHSTTGAREGGAGVPVEGYYPADLERVLTLPGATEACLRPIRPDDAARLVEFHRHLSPSSVYFRFFTAHPELRPEEVERFTRVDYVRRLALVVVADGALVAVGRYDSLDDPTRAEVAFVVLDHFQHHGLGTLLLEELAAAAWARGITEFEAQTLAENRPMLRVFFDSGFEVQSGFEGGTVDVHFSIAPNDAYRSARRARRAASSTDSELVQEVGP